MIQGGDPNTKELASGTPGTGGYGSMIQAEFSDVPHMPGVLSAARTNDPNSAQSQFFLMHKRSTHLDGKYSVYGRIVEGLDVVEKIVSLPTDHGDHPHEEDHARINDAFVTTWPVE